MSVVLALSNLSHWKKSLILFLFDIVAIIACYFLSFYLRLETFTPEFMEKKLFYTYFAICFLSQFGGLYFCGVYKGILRFASTHDLVRIIKGISFGVLASIIIIFFLNRLDGYPRSIFVINAILMLTTLGGGRFAYRIIRDRELAKRCNSNGQRVLIIGAGVAGERLIRDIRNSDNLDINVVGFIDDSNDKQGKVLHGIPILGKISDLPQIISEKEISQILIAIPSATSGEIRVIIKYCSDAKVKFKMLPKLKTIIEGTSLDSLQAIKPEDFLGRDKIELENNKLIKLIKGKSVLITGAGGSIGSELVKQIASLSPSQMYLIDASEFNLYAIDKELSGIFPQVEKKCIICDVRNTERVMEIFHRLKPEMVLHAAAYKHVPLMEANPYESIQTNIKGTLNISEACGRNNVSNFVLVSTDKAVNPTNVMGATKRAAEMVCLSRQKKYPETKFTIVRFGNVLGSSGSVIPLFREQIKKGGPVTITHPDIERFFMSIPEAASLILEASTMGNGGEIFILDMGQPVKILDLAKHMITLAGMKVDEDIKIKFTGLRPGEKMYEELFRTEEKPLPTHHPKVNVSRADEVLENFENELERLISIKSSNSDLLFKEYLSRIVVEYRATNIETSEASDNIQ